MDIQPAGPDFPSSKTFHVDGITFYPHKKLKKSCNPLQVRDEEAELGQGKSLSKTTAPRLEKDRLAAQVPALSPVLLHARDHQEMKVQELLCRLPWAHALGVGLISTSVVWSLPSAIHGLWRVKSGGQAMQIKIQLW